MKVKTYESFLVAEEHQGLTVEYYLKKNSGLFRPENPETHQGKRHSVKQ